MDTSQSTDTSQNNKTGNINEPNKEIYFTKKMSRPMFYLLNICFIIIFIIAMYYDIYFRTFSLKRWLSYLIPERVVHYILKVLGAYAIIQVLAQDIGLKTGSVQSKITHNLFVQFILFWGMAYAITDDGRQGFFGALLYFYLKFVVSEGETLLVCFEDT